MRRDMDLLAVPRDVAPDVNALDGVYLYAKDAVSLANYGAAVGTNTL